MTKTQWIGGAYPEKERAGSRTARVLEIIRATGEIGVAALAEKAGCTEHQAWRSARSLLARRKIFARKDGVKVIYSAVESEPEAEQGSALNVQVGGSHYRDMAIQPVEFIHKNRIGFIPGNVIKYVCRADKKGGIEDLKKARHYIDLLIEMEQVNASR